MASVSFLTWIAIFVCIVLGHASSPEEGDSKPVLQEVPKNATLPDNSLHDFIPTTNKPAPSQENCSDRTPRPCSSPIDLECTKLGRECLKCSFNCTCIYGHRLNVTCQPREGVNCKGKKEFSIEMTCQYCYQTDTWQHSCPGTNECKAVSSPRKTFTANCTVNSDVLCLGSRVFPKKLPCNWTSGYKWSTALLLSITLGGFGADRFYLGHWQEGIGKLFSFGGLGVWTIIDVILIAIRYIGPADGSLYI